MSPLSCITVVIFRLGLYNCRYSSPRVVLLLRDVPSKCVLLKKDDTGFLMQYFDF